MSIWMKKKLSKVSIPHYDEKGYRKTIANAKRIPLHSEIRMSNVEFFLDQIQFIRKQTWILKIVWIALMMYLVISCSVELSAEMVSLLAIGSPILFLINVRDIYSICMPDLIELHLSARNTMEKVLFVRLLLFGIMDFICLIGTSFFVSSLNETCIWQIIIYGFVPYNLTCLGCMYIINRWEEDVLLYCVSYSVFLSCIFTILRRHGDSIYAEQGIAFWIAAGIFISIGLFREQYEIMVKGREKLNGINIGRTV